MYSRTIPLLNPIKTDKAELKEIVVHTAPAKLTREVGQKYDLERDPQGIAQMDYMFDLAMLMTGLSETDISMLSTPDYNSLKDEVRKLAFNTSEDLLKEDFARHRQAGKRDKEPTISLEEPELLVPVTDEIAGEIKSYRLNPPTVGLTRKLRNEKDEHKRGMAISAQCTGLHTDIIDQFHMPDFNYLMGKLSDFLTEGSAFFQKQTSTD